MDKVRSLKRALFTRLVIPLIVFVIIDTTLTYLFTLYYVDEAYDRWLQDSAKSLIQEITVEKGNTVVELPPAALKLFQWDETDKTYFKIITDTGNIIAGDPLVPEPLNVETDWTQPVFFKDRLNGETVRVISMRVVPTGTTDPIYIHVAETLNKRRAMMRDIFLADLLPQVALILIVSLFLFSGVKRGLQPLHTLAANISKRSPRDLTPIPETHVFLEVKTLTNTINALFKKLDLAISSQQRFIANAAHQLKTPLAGLKLQAERAQREQTLETIKPALTKIQDCADRMSHLTSQLLILAKSEQIAGSQVWEQIELNKLVRTVCIDWVPKALTRKIELSLEDSKEPVLVAGDPILLGELLANLLDNAIAYGYQGGRIAVSLNSKPFICLSVEDNGPGIAQNEMAKVFERFYRIPGSPDEGCGLGLAIVKEIADRHHAKLMLSRSKNGQGTRIDLIFPNQSE